MNGQNPHFCVEQHYSTKGAQSLLTLLPKNEKQKNSHFKHNIRGIMGPLEGV